MTTSPSRRDAGATPSPSRLPEPPPAAIATPFRLAAAGVLGGAALVALVEWLVFRTSLAVGLLGLVLVLVPVAVVVDRRRGGAAGVPDERPAPSA